MTALQRRLASSPEAIFQSLKRRHARLEKKLREAKLGARGPLLAETLADVPEDDDDLPWNPNRLEQRFGRIHRIGQSEVCHLWNLVAKETREGDVYHRLLEKISVESEALKGRVFDILGEVFEEISLKDLLLQAIRYGD